MREGLGSSWDWVVLLEVGDLDLGDFLRLDLLDDVLVADTYAERAAAIDADTASIRPIEAAGIEVEVVATRQARDGQGCVAGQVTTAVPRP